MTLSTHVLDAARGRPAAGVPVRWESRGPDGAWSVVANGVTDRDGRIGAAVWQVTGSGAAVLTAGRHRLVFDVEAWPGGQSAQVVTAEGASPEGPPPDGPRPDGPRPDGTDPDGTDPDGTDPDAAGPFFPEVTITFAVTRAQAGTHHHVPLLLSPYAYSTYRGS